MMWWWWLGDDFKENYIRQNIRVNKMLNSTLRYLKDNL